MLHDEMLFLQNNGTSPLHIAASEGHDAVVEELLSYGVNVNQTKNDGTSPLYQPAWKGYVGVVTALLNHHADINLAMRDGDCPLHAAARWDQTAVVAILLDNKSVNVNQTNNKGQTPIDSAKSQEIKDMIIAHTKKQQQQQPQPQPPGQVPSNGQAVPSSVSQSGRLTVRKQTLFHTPDDISSNVLSSNVIPTIDISSTDRSLLSTSLFIDIYFP